MNEQAYTPREQAGSSGLDGIFDDGLGNDGLVTVSSGPYAEQLPVANMTVGEIRGRFRDRFDIDPRSQAVLAGNEVGDETVVRPGQLLMFVRRAGEKGAGSADRRVRGSSRRTVGLSCSRGQGCPRSFGSRVTAP
jgi:hypothetical protein